MSLTLSMVSKNQVFFHYCCTLKTKKYMLDYKTAAPKKFCLAV